MSIRAGIVALLAALVALTDAARGDDPKWRTTAQNVLVVYVANDADFDGSGKPDSQEIAEYYAARRGVPDENLLGLKLHRQKGKNGLWDYSEFFEQILTPVVQKLQDKDAQGTPFSRKICYILTCPTLTQDINTRHDPKQQDWFKKTLQRSGDQWLISAEANLKAGVNKETGAPGEGLAQPLGSTIAELALPLFGVYHEPAKAKHFRQLRAENPEQYGFYLVSRLGMNLRTASDMLDGALYAERYLRLPGSQDKTDYRPEIWLDQRYERFAVDHIGAMARAVLLVQGMPGGGFSTGGGLNRPWPLVMDNQTAEIGMLVDGAPHKPTVTARIARDGVSPEGVILVPPAQTAFTKDIPLAMYFTVGSQVTAQPPPPPPTRPATLTAPAATAKAAQTGKAGASSASAPAKPPTAIVRSLDMNRNFVGLSTTEGFKGGDILTSVWPGQYPSGNCFIFYGFYGLAQYEDVFKFPPGALGVHTDSCCMVWARAAMSRGIAATFGVTTEPLSAGIPYGDQFIIGLANGYDWAESAYSSIRLAQRWAGVLFGDPLYAPFRSQQQVDKTPPVIANIRAKAAGDSVVISAELGGQGPDELADVALFKLEYGQDSKYGKTVDFFNWPEPLKPKALPARRFGYGRHFSHTIKSAKGQELHFRLTARDPAGLETTTPDQVFTP
jgi:uncharacterized protein (TIGR03790 family)